MLKLPKLLLPQLRQAASLPQDMFRPVYKFTYIRGVGLINRLKLYHTAVTAMVLPATTILNQLSICTEDTLLATAIVGCGGMIPLYGFGYFAHKLVGILYLSEDQNLVKISYLDFWGNRKDAIVPLKDIVPFSEITSSFTDPLYLKVKRFSSKETMKLCHAYGILDPVRFNTIFSKEL